MVYRLYAAVGLVFCIFWLCAHGALQRFFYLLRRHAWLQREYLADLSGWRTRCLDDSFGHCYLFLDLPECSYHYLVAQNSFFGFYQAQRERIGGGVGRGGRG